MGDDPYAQIHKFGAGRRWHFEVDVYFDILMTGTDKNFQIAVRTFPPDFVFHRPTSRASRTTTVSRTHGSLWTRPSVMKMMRV